MDINRDTVEYIAELSKISLPDDKVDSVLQDIREVVGFFDSISQLDTDGVDPQSHVFNIHNILRDDEVLPSYKREDILLNAPRKNEDSFIVPRAVEQEG